MRAAAKAPRLHTCFRTVTGLPMSSKPSKKRTRSSRLAFSCGRSRMHQRWWRLQVSQQRETFGLAVRLPPSTAAALLPAGLRLGLQDWQVPHRSGSVKDPAISMNVSSFLLHLDARHEDVAATAAHAERVEDGLPELGGLHWHHAQGLAPLQGTGAFMTCGIEAEKARKMLFGACCKPEDP